MGAMACDIYVIGPDGTTGTTPVRSGVRGFTTVAQAEIPDEVVPGAAFVARIPINSQVLIAAAEQYDVVAHHDFVRVFCVTGGSIVAGSVTQTPAENASADSDQTTVSLGFTTPVPGGEEVTFPAARFEIVAADAGTLRRGVSAPLREHARLAESRRLNDHHPGGLHRGPQRARSRDRFLTCPARPHPAPATPASTSWSSEYIGRMLTFPLRLRSGHTSTRNPRRHPARAGRLRPDSSQS